MTTKLLVGFFKLSLFVILGTILSACGRKGDPDPLNKTDYPRQYPAQEPDCAV